jgi:ribonucleotide reductase alpha subunit
MAGPSFQKLSSALVYGWKSGLKTGVYYLRSQAAVEAIKYGSASKASTTHPSKVKGSSPRGAASGTEAAPPKASKTPRSKAAKEAAAAAAAAAAEEEPVFVCRRDDPSCEMCGS